MAKNQLNPLDFNPFSYKKVDFTDIPEAPPELPMRPKSGMTDDDRILMMDREADKEQNSLTGRAEASVGRDDDIDGVDPHFDAPSSNPFSN